MRFSILAIAACSAALYAAPISIYNTGVDNSNAVLTSPAVDPHWTMLSGPLGAGSLYVTPDANPIFNYWAPNNSTDKWIAPTTDPLTFDPPGTYVFRTTFDLTGLIAATGSLTGIYFADNTVTDVRLNGVSLGISGGDFTSPTSFVINCGSTCLGGVNTLDFVIANTTSSTSPMGLRVNIAGTADPAKEPPPPPPTGTPEPSTYAMMAAGLGLFSVASIGRRKKKS